MYRDPYTTDRRYYECRDCGHRDIAPNMPGTCPECDGDVKNIAVPRE